MANIIIIGAGSMGTAFSFPCSDNGHSVSIIGTHLENDFIDKINLEVNIEEKNTGEASIGAGYSSASDASLNLGLRENNFLGKGQKVKLESSFSNTRTSYDISITEPYLNNKSLSLTTSIYSNFTDPSSVNYETEDLGIGLAIGFPLASDKTIKTKYLSLIHI